jgi:hypothetical protein
MGLHLRATMLRQKNRLQLHAEVKKHGSKDSGVLVRTAFEVAVRRCFPSDIDLRVISALVQEMREAYGQGVPVLETEAMIRAALGEAVSTEDIGLPTQFAAMTFTLVALADKWDRDESIVNSVLVEAEEQVRQQGFDPTPAEAAV